MFFGAGAAIGLRIIFTIIIVYLLGVPYLPVTPYLAPLPLPVSLQLVYGRPMLLHGSPADSDDVIAEHVGAVKNRIASLLAQGRAVREASGGRRLGF